MSWRWFSSCCAVLCAVLLLYAASNHNPEWPLQVLTAFAALGFAAWRVSRHN